MATKKQTSKKRASKKGGYKSIHLNQPPTSGETSNIKLEFYLPPDLPLLYIDNVNVTHTPSEFIISFMQTHPPLLVREEDWDKIETIRSTCVARIVISPVRMQMMVTTLAENFQRYVDKYLQPEVQDGSANDTKTGNDRQ